MNMYAHFRILRAPFKNKMKQKMSFLLLKMELKSSWIIDHSEKSISGRVFNTVFKLCCLKAKIMIVFFISWFM